MMIRFQATTTPNTSAAITNTNAGADASKPAEPPTHEFHLGAIIDKPVVVGGAGDPSVDPRARVKNYFAFDRIDMQNLGRAIGTTAEQNPQTGEWSPGCGDTLFAAVSTCDVEKLDKIAAQTDQFLAKWDAREAGGEIPAEAADFHQQWMGAQKEYVGVLKDLAAQAKELKAAQPAAPPADTNSSLDEGFGQLLNGLAALFTGQMPDGDPGSKLLATLVEKMMPLEASNDELGKARLALMGQYNLKPEDT